MTERLQIPVLGTPEYWLAHDIGYLGDHAGIGETSLLMYLHPELVKLERLANDPEYGATDAIAKGATTERGKAYTNLIVSRLATLAAAMPDWNAKTRDAFVRAERALVSAQVRGWRLDHAWAAWRNIGPKGLTQYGQFLVEQRFTEIEHLAAQLSESA